MGNWRDDVLPARPPVLDNDFTYQRSAGLDETEMAMRKTTVVYVCDRCKAESTFDGEKVGKEFIYQELKKKGWRAVQIVLISGAGSPISRQLCSNCVKSLVEHLDNPPPLP